MVAIGDNANNLNTKKLKCLKCKADKVLSSDLTKFERKSMCYRVVPVVSECKVYEIQQTIVGSTFKCTECMNPATHYLNQVTNTCVQR